MPIPQVISSSHLIDFHWALIFPLQLLLSSLNKSVSLYDAHLSAPLDHKHPEGKTSYLLLFIILPASPAQYLPHSYKEKINTWLMNKSCIYPMIYLSIIKECFVWRISLRWLPFLPLYSNAHFDWFCNEHAFALTIRKIKIWQRFAFGRNSCQPEDSWV